MTAKVLFAQVGGIGGMARRWFIKGTPFPEGGLLPLVPAFPLPLQLLTALFDASFYAGFPLVLLILFYDDFGYPN